MPTNWNRGMSRARAMAIARKKRADAEKSARAAVQKNIKKLQTTKPLKGDGGQAHTDKQTVPLTGKEFKKQQNKPLVGGQTAQQPGQAPLTRQQFDPSLGSAHPKNIQSRQSAPVASEMAIDPATGMRVPATPPGQQPQFGGTPVPPAQQTVGDVAGIGTQTVNPAIPQPGQQPQPQQTAGAPQLTNPETGQPIPQPLMTMGSDIGGGNVKSAKNPSFSDGFGKTPRKKESTYMQRVAALPGGGKFGHGFGKDPPKKPPTREQQFKKAMSPNQPPPWADLPEHQQLAGFNTFLQSLNPGRTVAKRLSLPSEAAWKDFVQKKQKALFNKNRELADSLGIKWEKK